MDPGNKPVFLGGAEPSCFHPPGLSPLLFVPRPRVLLGRGFHLPSGSSASDRLLSVLPLSGPALSPALHPRHVRGARAQRARGRGVRSRQPQDLRAPAPPTLSGASGGALPPCPVRPGVVTAPHCRQRPGAHLPLAGFLAGRAARRSPPLRDCFFPP